jgi:hypothetical protein
MVDCAWRSGAARPAGAATSNATNSANPVKTMRLRINTPRSESLAAIRHRTKKLPDLTRSVG